MKRFFLRAALLVLTLCLLAPALLSCNVADEEEPIPENMTYATVAGSTFRLFVPIDWNLLTSSGISGAYISARSTALVFAKELSNPDSLAVEQYISDVHLKTLAEAFTADSVFAMSDPVKTLLGGKTAYYVDYSGRRDWKTYLGRDVLCQSGDTLYLLSFCALEDVYDNYIEVRDSITAEFLIDQAPYAPDKPINTVDRTADAPSGMQLASNEDVPYRLYVPSFWVLDQTLDTSSAYVSEDDRTNVRVTMHRPTEPFADADEYFAYFESDLRAVLPDMTLISTEQTTLDTRPAKTFIFTATVNGEPLRFAQTIAGLGDTVYTLTYTAKEADFERHLDEHRAIIAAFDFRGN